MLFSCNALVLIYFLACLRYHLIAEVHYSLYVQDFHLRLARCFVVKKIHARLIQKVSFNIPQIRKSRNQHDKRQSLRLKYRCRGMTRQQQLRRRQEAALSMLLRHLLLLSPLLRRNAHRGRNVSEHRLQRRR